MSLLQSPDNLGQAVLQGKSSVVGYLQLQPFVDGLETVNFDIYPRPMEALSMEITVDDVLVREHLTLASVWDLGLESD